MGSEMCIRDSNITGVLCSRSISISDAISAFENPVEVGNLIYRDGLQSSSGQYDSVNISGAVFSKTPNIDDSVSTTPYRPDSDTAIQNTITGTANSVISQINLIRGDATSQFDIQLEKPFGLLNKPFVFTKLLQGIRLAILRAGISRELPNPQVGVSNNFKDYSSCGPGAITGGNVNVSENSHIGIGAIIKNGIKIGKNTIIGGKSYVNKNCGNNSIYYGVPAKLIKKRKEKENYL